MSLVLLSVVLLFGCVLLSMVVRPAPRVPEKLGWAPEIRPSEREITLRGIPGATMQTVAGGGHFLSLDRPREVERLISEFAATSAT